MYDNICKFIAEEFSQDIATWLLGEAIALVELPVKELSLEPIRADAIVLRQSSQVVLHAEFQTEPSADIPFRMADYFLLIYRRYPSKRIRQIVVYLRPSGSRLVYQTDFATGGMNHQFEVIRLWEQPPDLFLSAPGLLPFAVLAHSEGKEALLREVARKVDEIDSQREQANVAASASLLVGLVLGKETIHQILRRDIMRESVIYQELIEEGRAEGKAEGRAEGLQEVARNLLAGGISVERVAGFTGLSLETVRELQAQMDN